MTFGLLAFAFAQGILTFFSACSVSLLPGFVAYVVGKNEDGSRLDTLKKGLYVGVSASIGFFIVFIFFGLLVSFASSIVGRYLTWIQFLTGGAIFVLGIAMLTGFSTKISFSFSTNFFKNANTERSFLGYFLYGVGYAISALGCTFPLFLATLLQALNGGGFVGAMGVFLMYAAGMSVLMIMVSVLSVYSKEFIQKKITGFMPYVTKVSGAVLVFAGLYLMNFAWTVIKVTL